MSETQTKEAPKRTASQRIEDLEKAFMSLYQTVDNVAREQGMIKEALQLLGNKLDAAVKAINRGQGVSDEIISNIMVEQKMDQLKSQVTSLVNQGLITPTEEVTERTFLVGREYNSQNVMTNPRVQFVLEAIQPEIAARLKGALVGDKIELNEDGSGFKLEILEVYSVAQPAAPTQEDGGTEAQAPAAPTSGNA